VLAVAEALCMAVELAAAVTVVVAVAVVVAVTLGEAVAVDVAVAVAVAVCEMAQNSSVFVPRENWLESCRRRISLASNTSRSVASGARATLPARTCSRKP
jgi:hypothetical protein